MKDRTGKEIVVPHKVSNITKTLIDMLTQRDMIGLKKYGVSLDRTDLTVEQWLQHMTEELLDAAGYAQAIIRTMNSAAGAAHGAESFQQEVAAWAGQCFHAATVHNITRAWRPRAGGGSGAVTGARLPRCNRRRHPGGRAGGTVRLGDDRTLRNFLHSIDTQTRHESCGKDRTYHCRRGLHPPRDAEDSARLDWLERARSSIQRNYGDDHWIVICHLSKYRDPSLRAAMDKAIADGARGVGNE